MGPDQLYTLLSAALASFVVFCVGPNPDLAPWYNPLAHLQLEAGFRFPPSISFTPSLPPPIPIIPSSPICLITEYRPLLERTPPPSPPSVSPSHHDLVSRIVSSTPEDVLWWLWDYKVRLVACFDQGTKALRQALTIASGIRTTNRVEFDTGVACLLLACWMVAIKVTVYGKSKTTDIFQGPPEAREVYLEEIDPSFSPSSPDPTTPAPSSTPPLTTSLSLPCLHSLPPLRPIVALPPLPKFSVIDRYGGVTVTPVALPAPMRLSEAPPVQLTGLDAAERAISVCMETEIGPSQPMIADDQEHRLVSDSTVTISTPLSVPVLTATTITALTQKRIPTVKDILFYDLPPSVTIDSLQEFGEANAPTPLPISPRLLDELKTLGPVDVRFLTSLPPDRALGAAVSTLSEIPEATCSFVSGIATIDESNKAQLSLPGLVLIGASVPLPSPRMFEFPRCYDLQDPGFVPASRMPYNFGSCWTDSQLTSFFRPQDSGGGLPSVLIVVDNTVYPVCGSRERTDIAFLRDRTVSEALKLFDVKPELYHWPRTTDGIPDRQMSYAVINFGSIEEAERAFRMFQGGRMDISSRRGRL